MTNLSIEIECSCGGTHRLPLDAGGHYSGPLPCDLSKRAELQVDAREWREMVEAERAKVKH